MTCRRVRCTKCGWRGKRETRVWLACPSCGADAKQIVFTDHKPLQLWNGRWFGGDSTSRSVKTEGYVYAAAYSRADLIRLIVEIMGYEPRGSISEIRDYWNHGHWGIAMNGITPERGVWYTDQIQRTPRRLIAQRVPDGKTHIRKATA